MDAHLLPRLDHVLEYAHRHLTPLSLVLACWWLVVGLLVPLQQIGGVDGQGVIEAGRLIYGIVYHVECGAWRQVLLDRGGEIDVIHLNPSAQHLGLICKS